mmetsp:Transcript_49619/g.105968  ORF Transcript_49619/g.105968 Transcript_49619/m.105968 type:complete len:287 (-) Transcript_49619:1787-2647(-)
MRLLDLVVLLGRDLELGLRELRLDERVLVPDHLLELRDIGLERRERLSRVRVVERGRLEQKVGELLCRLQLRMPRITGLGAEMLLKRNEHLLAAHERSRVVFADSNSRCSHLERLLLLPHELKHRLSRCRESLLLLFNVLLALEGFLQLRGPLFGAALDLAHDALQLLEVEARVGVLDDAHLAHLSGEGLHFRHLRLVLSQRRLECLKLSKLLLRLGDGLMGEGLGEVLQGLLHPAVQRLGTLGEGEAHLIHLLLPGELLVEHADVRDALLLDGGEAFLDGAHFVL